MDVASEAEGQLRELSGQLTEVREGECLACYLERMGGEFGCIGHRFTERWRDAQPGRMPGLLKWLKRNGGYCDCEVIMNVFWDARRSRRHERLQCDAYYQRTLSEDEDDDEDDDELEAEG